MPTPKRTREALDRPRAGAGLGFRPRILDVRLSRPK
jgi:hypothetical protein